MKNTIITFIVLLLTITLNAQSPQGFKYQAVIYDSEGELISEGDVSIKISILEGSEAGSTVYMETHDVTTSPDGLVSLTIGDGTTTDDFSSINWGLNDYFLKIEVDPEGGSSYMHMGTTQLLSVPYAMHAHTTDSIFGNTINSTHIVDGSISHNDINEGTGSGLDADLLDGQSGDYYQSASNINTGYLNTDRYSARYDLYAEGYLDNNSANDILYRSQSDDRYNKEVAFYAYNNASITISTNSVVKINFSHERMDMGYNYNAIYDRFTAPYDGVYCFNAAVNVGNVSSGTLILSLYVNNSLSSVLQYLHPWSAAYLTMAGTTTVYLSAGDQVDLRITSSTDTSYNIFGNSYGTFTWFSGHLVFRDL